MSYDCVVDASVGIKLFLVEDLADAAHALFSRLADTPPARLIVPDLFIVECANILWKYCRRFNYPPDDAQQNIADLISLPLNIISNADLVMEALSLAVTHEITAYDAAYVALSQQFDLPLITADEKLVRKLTGAGFDVRYLGEATQS
ncbi:MAG: type II toxin-antitoxin system VapC family toxin [Anaerolineales bacterium]|nr:type II toxin-antitoxin system VapC family toxin [Anaerolineales bacterium]